MKKSILLLLQFAFAIVLFSCGSSNKTASPETVYQCPMKCESEKTYDKPGQCPVCKMDLAVLNSSDSAKNQKANNSIVKIAGAMKNVMHKGELFATIDLDTIKNKTHLYGLGPVEYLKGEILILDGKSYQSSMADDGSIKMEETFKTKAPFFVYANVEKWNEITLPDSIQNIKQLETFLDQNTKNHPRPFAFRLTTNLDSCSIHIVNLPTGTPVHSPEDAHKNQKTFELQNEHVELIGFFSTEHQGIFTHHDTYVHIHLISDDRKQMGHVDNLKMKKGTAKLFISKL